MVTMVGSDKLPFMDGDLGEPESRLLEVISECSGRVEGRTKLMKLVFFSEYYNPEEESLQSEERMGVFDDFILYNHGPFSRRTMNVFDSLKQQGLLEEETELTFTGNRRKIINITEEGREMVQEMDSPDDNISTVCSTFAKNNASTLEQKSLDLLGITRDEKDQYRNKHVTHLIN